MKLTLDDDMDIIKKLAAKSNASEDVKECYAIMSAIATRLEEIAASIRDIPMKRYHDAMVDNILNEAKKKARPAKTPAPIKG